MSKSIDSSNDFAPINPVEKFLIENFRKLGCAHQAILTETIFCLAQNREQEEAGYSGLMAELKSTVTEAQP